MPIEKRELMAQAQKTLKGRGADVLPLFMVFCVMSLTGGFIPTEGPIIGIFTIGSLTPGLYLFSLLSQKKRAKLKVKISFLEPAGKTRH